MTSYDPEAILTDPNAPLVHKVYAAINIGIRDRGEQWSLCANCGLPYQLTEYWTDVTVCSESCHQSFLLHIGEWE